MDMLVGMAVVVGVGLILMIIVLARDTKREKQRRQIAKDYYELNYKHSNEGMYARTYEEAKKHLTQKKRE